MNEVSALPPVNRKIQIDPKVNGQGLMDQAIRPAGRHRGNGGTDE